LAKATLTGFFYMATVGAEAFGGLALVRERDRKLYRDITKAIN
jgi:hypothetical protein